MHHVDIFFFFFRKVTDIKCIQVKIKLLFHYEIKLCQNQFSNNYVWLEKKCYTIIVLCPSPNCQIRVRVRVRVITSLSKSESESSPQSPSPSQKKIQVRVTSPVVHIFDISLSSKTWKQTKYISLPHLLIRVEKAQYGTAATAWTRAWLGPSHESRFLSLSPSQSKKNWTRVRVIKKWTRVPTWVAQHC